MQLNEAIAKRISNLMQERKLTAYEIAKRGGIAKQVVYAVASGAYKKVSVDVVYQIAATLGLTLEEFFADKIFFEVSD